MMMLEVVEDSASFRAMNALFWDWRSDLLIFGRYLSIFSLAFLFGGGGMDCCRIIGSFEGSWMITFGACCGFGSSPQTRFSLIF